VGGGIADLVRDATAGGAEGIFPDDAKPTPEERTADGGGTRRTITNEPRLSAGLAQWGTKRIFEAHPNV
jgi:hypothetical protein